MHSAFWEIVRFEIRFRFRHASTYLFFAVLFALSLIVMSTDADLFSNRDGRAFMNAPASVSLIGTILTMLGGIIVTAVMGTAIYRDFEANVYELFFSTRLTKRDYYFGRFLGAFLVTAIIFSAIPLGFMLGPVVPWSKNVELGPFRADGYLELFFVFMLPNLFLMGALFFVWGALTRNLLAIYMQAIVLLVFWVGSAVFLSSLQKRETAALLEPLGIAAGYDVTMYWTLVEQNEKLIPLAGTLLQNRLLWGGAGIVVLLGGYFLFDLSHSPLTWKRAAKKMASVPYPLEQGRALATPVDPVGSAYGISVYLRLVRYYTREILRGIPFLIVTLTGIVLLILSLSEAGKIFDTPVYPVTRVVLDAISESFGLFFFALITFYSGELIWRERTLRADQTTDTLPVSNTTVLLSKITAVLLMCGVLNAVLILTGIGAQISKGYYHFELPLYMSRVYGLGSVTCVMITLLAFFLHTVINNKFLAHGAFVLLFTVSSWLSNFGWERHIYHFGSLPDIVYSDMNGYGPFLVPTLWWKTYWLSFAVLLVLAALRFWVRGTDNGWRTRWKKVDRLPIAARVSVGLAALTFFGTGAFLVYNTDVLHKYYSSAQGMDLQAGYERSYKAKWAKKPMPRVTGVKLDITLYPERQQYMVSGVYRLKNKTTKTIREIVLDYDSDLEIDRLQFGSGARAGIVDRKVGFRSFTLNRPLVPGQETTLIFAVAYRKRGFPNDAIPTDIAGNGTFLHMPVLRIGYQDAQEIDDYKERNKRNLPSQEDTPPATDMVARGNTYIGNDADWIDFEATVRTTPDQIALAPGYLQREWTEKGRHCFHYKMDAPIRNFYSILSARYAVKRDTWTSRDGKKVALEIYYHPAHPYNLHRMMAGMKASLAYCSENYSPYQFRQLRIIEFPAYMDLAQSFPNTIPYSEGIGFIARVEDNAQHLDYPLFVTAHETAHQWWAHQVLGGDVAGSEMLSESLAEYSALMVLQHKYGANYAHRLLRYDLDQYLSGRGSDSSGENPLVETRHQQYIHYRKGAIVFYALAERLGEKRLNQILSRFLQDKRYQEPPYTTAPELVAYLKKGATRDEKSFIHDLFERITLYELRAEKATAKKLKNGTWRVHMDMTVKKVVADDRGVETAVPLNDLVEVGIFATPTADEQEKEVLGKPLLLKRLMLRNPGKKDFHKALDFTVAQEPYQIGIDPYNILLDQHPDNNVMVVTK